MLDRIHLELPAPSLSWHPRALRSLDSCWDSAGEHFPALLSDDRALTRGAPSPPESFTATIIGDLLLGRSGAEGLTRRILAMLEREVQRDAALFFFKEQERLPADADCTAMALSLLLRAGRPVAAVAHRALDRILANVDGSGVIATYFDPTGERAGIVDPVVCVNALYLARQLGRAGEARRTDEFVCRVLLEERYLHGTRYYQTAESFLYFLGRLVCAFPEAYASLREPLRRAVARRIGTSPHPIDLAQRVIVARWLGGRSAAEQAMLQLLQRSDGGWPGDSLFRYGRSQVLFGSASLSTAFAVAALAGDAPRPVAQVRAA